MPTSLPQHDPHPRLRALRLERRRRQVRWCYTHVAPLAIAEDVPRHHAPDWAWWAEVLRVADQVLENTQTLGEKRGADTSRIRRRREQIGLLRGEGDGGRLARWLDSDEDSDEAPRKGDRPGVRERVSELLDTPWQKVISDAADELAVGMVQGRARRLSEFLGLFRTLPPSPEERGVVDDAEFAWLRLAGPNPLVIRRLQALPTAYPGQDAALRTALERAQVAPRLALQQGRLYACDYGGLAGLEPGRFPVDKVVCAPLALFVRRPDEAQLRPVAIQCVQAPGQPVFTPADGWAWQAAKLTVQVADGNHHEAVSHLGRTHLRVEPFVVATERQLDRHHPLFRLLRPHFEGTLFINNSAHCALIAPRGTVDRLMSGSIEASRGAAVAGLQDLPFTRAGLPQDLADRDMEDPALDYPYRDDGRLLWAALERWVGACVQAAYPKAAALGRDAELQAWAAELASAEGGRVQGFPARIEDPAALTQLLTTLIFTASAQHAAVNFPQYGSMANASNYPLGLYAAPPTPGCTEADFLAMLPPLDQGLIQLNLGYLLGNIHYTRLGRYAEGWFEDNTLVAPLRALHAALDAATATIQDRNTRRPRPYPYLLPDQVPQSINI